LLALAGVVFAQVVPTYIEFIAVQKAVDKAADRGVIHPNRAARLKARLAKSLRHS